MPNYHRSYPGHTGMVWAVFNFWRCAAGQTQSLA